MKKKFNENDLNEDLKLIKCYRWAIYNGKENFYNLVKDVVIDQKRKTICLELYQAIDKNKKVVLNEFVNEENINMSLYVYDEHGKPLVEYFIEESNVISNELHFDMLSTDYLTRKLVLITEKEITSKFVEI